MDPQKTSLELLKGLGELHNNSAWQHFDTLYRPMLIRFTLRLGLTQDEADEVAQRTEIALHTALQHGQYDHTKGKFRNFLLGIARHVVQDLYTERSRQPIQASQRTSIGQVLSMLSDPDASQMDSDGDWQASVLKACLRRAAQQFSSRDMQVFDMLVVQDLPADQVIRQFELSRDAVYQIKHRILKFITEVKKDIERLG
jgi:RNA polymerase sigma factor (sigma-70 family)